MGAFLEAQGGTGENHRKSMENNGRLWTTKKTIENRGKPKDRGNLDLENNDKKQNTKEDGGTSSFRD